jgi:hypothetical protein
MTDEDVKVRRGGRADETDILKLCHELHAENGMFDMDDACVCDTLTRAYDRQGAIIGVIDGDNEIAAAIFLCLSRLWYRPQEHLEELFNYVRPKYRKTRYADTLIEFAKTCSDQTNLPLMIGVVTNKRLESKVRLYRRKLGLPSGAWFVHGVPSWGNDSVIDIKGLWGVHAKAVKG